MFETLKEDIEVVMQRDPAAKSKLEVVLCYPGLHAIWLHRLAHKFYKRGWILLPRLINTFSRFLTGIDIHPGAQLSRGLFIDHGMGVVIGETAEIGDDCTIYQGVTLGGTSLTKGAKRHPTLEAGVIIGAGAKVLGNFTVGAGAKIGSNAVVVKPVPAGATAVGNPAHIVGSKPTNEHEFSAYGVNVNDSDPIVQALQSVLAQLERSDATTRELRSKIEQAGIDCGTCEDDAQRAAKDIERIRQLLAR